MKHQRAFTLVELIVVIVLTGILAGTVSVFFKPAVDAYFASQRRAQLADMADTTLRKMAREIRTAVPNSILDHDGSCIEFVPSVAGGRYRMAAHVNDDGTPQENSAASCPDTAKSCALDLTASPMKQSFDVFQLSQSATPVPGDFVVIGNQEPGQIYGGTNRKLISSFAALPSPVIYGTHRIDLGSGDFSSIQGYEEGRFFVAPAAGSVAFVCSGGKLYRVSRALGSATPESCPGVTGQPVLAEKVSQCTFVHSSNPGTQQNSLVWMEVTLTDDGESVALALGVHASNVP